MTPSLYVMEYHLVNYRRTWRASVLSSLVLPLLTMLGFGVGVGAYVTGGVEGVGYLQWMVPGLIATTAVQGAIGESTWPVMSCFEWVKIYFAQAAAPLRVADILGGHLAFMLFRVFTSVAAFLLIAALFGALRSVWALAVLPIGLLLALAAAAPVAAYTASVSSDSYLAILLRFAVLPMSLFSGVFFPVESLPEVLRWVAYALPLWHGVDLSRAATLGLDPGPEAVWQALYLVAWGIAGWFLAHWRYRSRLVI
ncbi:lipooligosaccharide transport system permease protein [Actinoplanes campanulatus]|uniref:Transport permease protein n=1 Tax=Actinoplanes campanulatus TaxID=113559 RepID=A0A7W5AQX3_9ACTN|nr:ABC transporter permease [Actinoplanes campanulatus]MBB3100189.1 lipooligosaccharide transport system permease protein [Actinoplanes campanulatus]GGN28762.1 transport permease protein [Actinoplanes campanulatus]GID39000.1 transport permease protein [Actinoplanes campanulatus]